jgi:hypothetical protein
MIPPPIAATGPHSFADSHARIFFMSQIVSLSTTRRAVIAMLDYAKAIPTVPVARRMDLAPLMAARAQSAQPPSWSAIFMRAYGITSMKLNQLRRCWLSWPYPRLYEHPSSECAVAVDREWEGERAVFYNRVCAPETLSLDNIHNHLTRLQTEDIRTLSAFRSLLRFGKLPRLLQKMIMKWKLDVSGPRHVRAMGTFGLTNYGMLGAESLHPIGPQATVLTLGPISPKGEITVKLIYDHRIFDGGYIARSLKHLEEVLHTSILGELRQLSRQAA